MEVGDQSMEGWVGQQYGRISRPGEKLKCPVEIYLGASVSYGQYWTSTIRLMQPCRQGFRDINRETKGRRLD